MKRMTLMQHFAELRRRILWCALIFMCAVCVGWCIAPFVQSFLTTPLMRVWGGGTMLYTAVTDGLMIRFSLSVTVGILIVLPVVLWHVWAYIAPGLRPDERGFIWPVLVMSPILFLMGAAFAFYILFPSVFRFFIELNQAAPVPTVLMPAARDYLTFALGLLKVFGLAFQLPLVMILLNRVGILSRAHVIRMRRYAIVAIVIVAAMLTPPDIVSQILLAVPMWLLFEASILFMRHDLNAQ